MTLIKALPIVRGPKGPTDEYAAEEIATPYGYPNEYEGPRPINNQIKALAEIFDLDPTKALVFAEHLPPLPEGAEGWFAIMTPESWTRDHFPQITKPHEQYIEATLGLLAHLARSRDGKIDQYILNPEVKDPWLVHPHTLQAINKISKQQKGDIWIIAAQLGEKHAGRSPRRARACFAENEFGLTSFMTAVITLIHPTRLIRSAELDMNCPGDTMFNPYDNGAHTLVPRLYLNDNGLCFSPHMNHQEHALFGSATGFLLT